MPAPQDKAVRSALKVLDNLWKTKDLCQRYDVTAMTVFNWRTRKRDPLPCVEVRQGKASLIMFEPDATTAWYRRNFFHG